MIDISKKNKAMVLAGLYNGTKALGMGFLHDKRDGLSKEEAEEVISEKIKRCEDLGFGKEYEYILYFDYVSGRPIKVNLSGDEFDSWLYDRDAGKGAAKKIIDSIADEN